MDRRHFLGSAMATAATLRIPAVRAQSPTRGAVVIGVDKPGNLTPLKAAKSGAKSVAEWLQNEGFDVKLFVDDSGPVTVSNVFTAINRFIEVGTFDQLVVYFAGHGFISGTLSEFWMLSGAPQNPNEAVSLTESCKYAEESGIPSVVFISDACRSPAESLGVQRLQGGVLFPSSTNPPRISDVDQFLAARIGTSAYEVAPAGDPAAAQGIFTSCFLEAFRNPYPSMIETVEGRLVVPNRRLKKYLAVEVPKKAQSMSVLYNQLPDSKVYSDEPTYIAHVSGSGRAAQPPETATLLDVAKDDISVHVGLSAPNPSLRALRASSGFDQAKHMIVEARGLAPQLPARSGFVVSGRHLTAVTARAGVTVKFNNSPSNDTPSSLVDVDLGSSASASVALRFADGSGTVLAALHDYVGIVTVGPVGVSNVNNVSYEPSVSSPMHAYYEQEAGHVQQLRASVATAAQFGVFRFDGDKNERKAAASNLADRIRVLKGIDPTLGLYAAYAYDDADLKDKVQSVRGFMRDTLRIDLCDVVMLSGGLPGRTTKDWRQVTPFCPMLSQGWGLLRVKNVQLPEAVARARDHLQVSLWNSLAPAGVALVEDALKSGVVG